MRLFRRIWNNGSASLTLARDEEDAANNFNDRFSDYGHTDERDVQEVHQFTITLEQTTDDGDWIAFLDDEDESELADAIIDSLEDDGDFDEDDEDNEDEDDDDLEEEEVIEDA